MVAYEQQLSRNLDWAFREGSMHFEKESAVHKALRSIAGRLEGLGIPYAIAGGMALFFHGYRRFTEVVDILVTREGLEKIHRQGSKNLRDAESGVRIEFLVAGDFPGDGKPKPVAFPQPEAVRIEREGLYFLSLPALVELKLASGMTNPTRLQDLADVQRLIQELSLPMEFEDELNPFVQGKYRELWMTVRQSADDSE